MSDVDSPTATVRTTDVVRYQSAGHCVVIGETATLLEKAANLSVPRWTAIRQEPGKTPEKLLGEGGEVLLNADGVEVEGHLGDFRVQISSGTVSQNAAEMAGDSRGGFDTVLDLRSQPGLQHHTLPFGYFAPRSEAEFDEAVASLAELTGEFEKPRYFRYDQSICAHSASKQIGCTRCLDACDTGAIQSLVDFVEVDPYLCQGCGHCATVCPTGAMRYALPDPKDSAAALRTELLARDDRPMLLFYARDHADSMASTLAGLSESVASRCLPVAVEEAASVGPETWWAALAWGASRIVLLSSTDAAARGTAALQREMETTHALLEGLGLDRRAVSVCELASLPELLADDMPSTEWPVGRFGVVEEKRGLLRLAIDHLFKQLPATQPSVPLPAHAAFGSVVANDACTLCMSCVSVCPSGALMDGSGVPALRFIENLCVQCGLCESACPETAITREQRFVFDVSIARETRELRAEDPFLCVECAKPFAVKSVIEKMQTKLEGHWMFQDTKARRRLLMCEDCRIKDQF